MKISQRLSINIFVNTKKSMKLNINQSFKARQLKRKDTSKDIKKVLQMPSIIRSTPFSLSLDDGGAIVKTILGILFLGILCSMVHLVYYPSPSELSKAEVNIDFGDSGDSITASATIRVEAPVGEQDDASSENILLPSLLPDIRIPDISLPDISLPDVSLPDISLPDISQQMPNFPSHSLPKCCQVWNPDCSWLEHMHYVILPCMN